MRTQLRTAQNFTRQKANDFAKWCEMFCAFVVEFAWVLVFESGMAVAIWWVERKQ